MTYDELYKIKNHAEVLIKLIDGLPTDDPTRRFEPKTVTNKTVNDTLRFFLKLNPQSPLKVFR